MADLWQEVSYVVLQLSRQDERERAILHVSNPQILGLAGPSVSAAEEWA